MLSFAWTSIKATRGEIEVTEYPDEQQEVGSYRKEQQDGGYL